MDVLAVTIIVLPLAALGTFFASRKLNMFLRIALAVVSVLIAMFVITLLAWAVIGDNPGPGSRAVTKQELEDAAK